MLNRSFKIRAYFPELKEISNNYIAKYSEYRLIQITIYLKYKGSEPITNEENELLAKLAKEFVEISTEMLNSIIEETEKYK